MKKYIDQTAAAQNIFVVHLTKKNPHKHVHTHKSTFQGNITDNIYCTPMRPVGLATDFNEHGKAVVSISRVTIRRPLKRLLT